MMKSVMRKILCGVIIPALMCLCLSAFAGGADVEAVLAGMSLRDKAAQMLIISPREWKADPASEKGESITALNDALRAFFAENHFGAVLLYAENCHDAEQLLRLTSDIQQAAVDGGGLPMFVSIDQEGGSVSRLTFGTSGVGSMALAATGDPENARTMARVHGEELQLLGINVNYAPVMDINDDPANPIIGVRSFGDTPGIVSEYGVAFMRGLHDTGTIATLKHFPGHGDTDVDSHTGLPLVDRSLDELRQNELIPFKAAIDAGADMVMTAHIQYPQVETQTYVSVSTGEEIYIPATMSKTILTDILRGELGFEGVIVSDALEMAAISENYALDDVLTMSINAGVNMLMPPRITDAGSMQSLSDIVDRVVSLAEAGTIDMWRIDDAVRRILTLKQRYGLLNRTDFTVTEARAAEAVAGTGSAEHRQIAWDIALKGLTLLKNENDAFPMDVKPGESTLILISAESRSAVGEQAKALLGGLGEDITGMVIEKNTSKACAEAARAADHVVVVSRAWNGDSMNPDTGDGWPVGAINRIIDDCHADGKAVIVISAQLPYDAACYPGADAILLAYSSSVTRSVPPASGPGSAYVPNLPAAICACFGVGTPEGRLPVSLPRMDGDGRLTGEVIYPRQIGADNGGD